MAFKNLRNVYPEPIIIDYIFNDDAKSKLYFTNNDDLDDKQLGKKEKLIDEVEQFFSSKSLVRKLVEWLFLNVDTSILIDVFIDMVQNDT